MKKEPRTFIGKVVSDKMDKTVSVHIQRRVRHPLYGKYITRTTKLHVHDEENKAKVGDKVQIKETRPLAKTKSFKIISINPLDTQNDDTK